MTFVPITLKVANRFIAVHHRHHQPERGCRFCIGVMDSAGQLRGVAVVGRPKARRIDQTEVAEVTRLCTDGFDGACSALYRRCHRICQLMGFKRLITYTLPEEGGGSLRALRGLFDIEDEEAGGGQWSKPSRHRLPTEHTGRKVRWGAVL